MNHCTNLYKTRCTRDIPIVFSVTDTQDPSINYSARINKSDFTTEKIVQHMYT